MPSISQTTISPTSSKKRRRDDDAAQVQVKIPRYVLSLQFLETGDWASLLTQDTDSPRYALHDSVFNNAANRDDFSPLNPERKQIIPRRRLHEQKRQRIEVRDETHFLPSEVLREGEEERVVPRAKIDLSPCHVCYRKPTDKSQLDSYAYCEGCGERTCFVCMRVCDGAGHTAVGIGVGDGAFSFEFQRAEEVDGQGGGGEGGKPWQRDRIEGHRGRICSRCCVERGAEGDVCCLGCLRTEEGMS